MTGAAKLSLSTVILFLSAFLAAGFAQQAPGPAPATATQSLVVNVFDAQGNAVRDLAKENFHLRLNGKPATVLAARYSLAPRRIVVLLDMSGSMIGDDAKANGKWRMAREAADDLLAETPVKVPIALLTFSGAVRDVFDFSQGRTAIAKWLTEAPGKQPNVKYPGRTALFDAIVEGVKLLQPVQPGDSVYAITDGGDNSSETSPGQAKAALLQSRARLFAFLLAEPLVVPAEQAEKESFLSVVYDSGGFAFGVSGREPVGSGFPSEHYVYDDDHPEKIKLFTQRLNVQVNGFWTLEVAGLSSKKSSKVKLEVVGVREE
jgi:hypothetical protein